MALVTVDTNSGAVSGGHATKVAHILTTQVAPDSSSVFWALTAEFSGIDDPGTFSVLVAAALTGHVADTVPSDGAGQVPFVAHGPPFCEHGRHHQ